MTLKIPVSEWWIHSLFTVSLALETYKSFEPKHFWNPTPISFSTHTFYAMSIVSEAMTLKGRELEDVSDAIDDGIQTP